MKKLSVEFLATAVEKLALELSLVWRLWRLQQAV